MVERLREKEAFARGDTLKRDPPLTYAKAKKIAMLGTVSSGGLVVALTLGVAVHTWVNNIITFSMRSIEILGPVVSDHERLTLRAEFFSVRDTAGFDAFYRHLQADANQNKVRLPMFSPL